MVSFTLSASGAALRPSETEAHTRGGPGQACRPPGARRCPGRVRQSSADPGKMGCEGPSPRATRTWWPGERTAKQSRGRHRQSYAAREFRWSWGFRWLHGFKGWKTTWKTSTWQRPRGPGLTRCWPALCHSRRHVCGGESETLRLPTSVDTSTPPHPTHPAARGNVPGSTVPCSNIYPAHPPQTHLSESGEESVHQRRLPVDGVSDAVPFGHPAAEETQHTFQSK